MTTERIKVIGVSGRVAFTAARGGERIPQDKPVRVIRTSWIERRLTDGDIVIFDERKAASAERKAKRLENPAETTKQEVN